MKSPLETIPEHLQEYITEQDPSLYTPIDQAVWRYVMKVSQAFFSKHGHPLYLQGLETTGISTDRIPLVSEMDQALRKIGWRAVVINGFIPPAIFLEFQALRILAIACDIRKLENIGYTPSPDIIHEAAGHVPIVADPEYRKYLEAYGEVARNAVITKFDLDLYDAIFALSEIKENPNSTREAIAGAQAHFEAVAKQESEPSEAALLTRMAWWTTEYGLLEVDGKPLIYGAGLLSSIHESYHCLNAEVKKVPFNLKATIDTSYDITRPQPQLFVAKSFEELTQALEEFAKTMAFRRGGMHGLKVAVAAQNTVTVVLDNGIQITGTILDTRTHSDGTESAFLVGGMKQISFEGRADENLSSANLPETFWVPLKQQNGFSFKGETQSTFRVGKSPDCTWYKNATLSNADGATLATYPGAVPHFGGTRVVSVFGGAADRQNFLLHNRKAVSKVASHKSNLTPENQSLNELYRQVSAHRDAQSSHTAHLHEIEKKLEQNYPSDWLLRLELLELLQSNPNEKPLTEKIIRDLNQISSHHDEFREMIQRGLKSL
jgi:phenylalanine-4-hydroxylase